MRLRTALTPLVGALLAVGITGAAQAAGDPGVGITAIEVSAMVRASTGASR